MVIDTGIIDYHHQPMVRSTTEHASPARGWFRPACQSASKPRRALVHSDASLHLSRGAVTKRSLSSDLDSVQLRSVFSNHVLILILYCVP